MEGGPPPDAPPAAAPNPPDAFNALTSSELPGEFFRPGRDGMCTSGKALRFFASRAGDADSPSEPRAAAAFASACDCAERSEDDVGGATLAARILRTELGAALGCDSTVAVAGISPLAFRSLITRPFVFASKSWNCRHAHGVVSAPEPGGKLDRREGAHVVVGLRLAVLGVLLAPPHHLVHVVARVLEHLALLAEDEHADLALAQDRQLHRLLEQALLPLHEGHLPIPVLPDGLDDDLLPPHERNFDRGGWGSAAEAAPAQMEWLSAAELLNPDQPAPLRLALCRARIHTMLAGRTYPLFLWTFSAGARFGQ